MEPNQFIEQVASSGQVSFYADELSRRKAVDYLVSQAEITDTKGAKVAYQV